MNKPDPFGSQPESGYESVLDHLGDKKKESTSQEIEDRIKQYQGNSNPKLKIGIGLEGGFVKLDFSKPVEKLIITKQQARELSRRLIQVTIK